MEASERLTDIYERARRQGLDSLTAVERELWLIQDFILQHDGGGLSGYFYNRLPDLGYVQATVDAMRRHGLPQLAGMLHEALQLFSGYVDPDPPTTWGKTLRRYDPTKRLDVLSDQIYDLADYGLDESGIS